MSSVRFRLAPPNCATNILEKFPSSHLGEGCRLLTGEGRFESCGGSQTRPSLARLCLLAVRNLPSQGGNTGSNPVGGSSHLPVAQMDERPATNRRHAGSTPAGKANRQGVAQQAERRAWDAEAAGS